METTHKGKSLSVFAVLALSLGVLAPASRADSKLDEEAHGMIGAQLGFSFHTGRTVPVDAVSGATSQKNTDEFSGPAGTISPVVDFGLPTSDRLARGTFGMRLYGNFSMPGRYMEFVFMPRYRLKFDVDREKLFSVEPWMGIGISFAFLERMNNGPFTSFPLVIGCDFQIIVPNLYMTMQLDVSMLNPWGPGQKHYDNFMFKMGLAYAFY